MVMVNTHEFPTGPGLNPSQAGPPSNITTASGVECYDQLHRPDKELRLRGVKESASSHTAKKWQSWDPNPGLIPHNDLLPRTQLDGLIRSSVGVFAINEPSLSATSQSDGP